MNEIYMKCIISFIVGVFVYKMICSLIICNKDIIEGQGCLDKNPQDRPVFTSKDASDCDGITGLEWISQSQYEKCWERPDVVSNAGPEWDTVDLQQTTCVNGDNKQRAWVTNGLVDSPNNTSLQINEFNDILVKMDVFYKAPGNLYSAASIINKLMKIAGVTEDQNNSQDNIKNNIKKLSDFGKLSNGNLLNYLEMGIRKFTNGDATTIKNNIITEYPDLVTVCKIDLYTYVSAFLISFYNSFNQNNASSDEYSNIMVISNRLTKYIPEILDKIDEIYKTCNGIDPDINELKHKIIKDMHNTLLKNNVTKVSFTGLGDIMEKLKNVKSIYILLFMLCLTFIVIKFMGMFKLSVNV